MQGPSINLADTTPVVCPECGGQVFNQAFIIREVSPLLTGTGEPGLIPVTVFECVKCHHVPEKFLPLELQDDSNCFEDKVDWRENQDEDSGEEDQPSGKVIKMF